MGIETVVGDGNQFLVKTLLTDARFIPGDEHDGAALWVECKGNAPDAVIGGKAQFLHVGMAGAFERVAMRPLQRGAKFAQ